jgi:hypothetical protein
MKVNSETESPDNDSKKTFVLSIANVRSLLDLDPDFRTKIYKRKGNDSSEKENDDEDKEIYLSF